MPPFNLPRPWSPGYALPKTVRVENLQRGSFVTGWMPRGWYDDPQVGAGGYTIPDYVASEPYGQGARVTKMMPRGSTVIPVPHWVQHSSARLVAQTKATGGGTNYEIAAGSPSAVQPGSATANLDVFHVYGNRVASHVMKTITKVPPAQRKSAMRALFNKIDPRLYNRIDARASKATQAGIPPKRALHHAIATEFRSGMLRELGTLGTAKKIRRASQVGLSCYGCAALGDTTPPGHWERARAGQKPTLQCADGSGYVWAGSGTPIGSPTGCVVRVHKPGEVRTDIPVGTPVAPHTMTPFQTVQVGPLSFRTGAGVNSDTIAYPNPGAIPGNVLDWVKQRVDGQIKCCFQTRIGSAIAQKYDPGQKQYDDNPAHYWLGYGEGYYLDDGEWYSSGDGFPAESIVDPISVNGTDYGVFLFMRGRDPHADAYGNAAPRFWLKFAPMDFRKKGVWGNITSTVSGWFGSVSGWAGDAADAIGGFACDILGHPEATAAAAAASGGAAAAGAAIAGSLCSPKKPPATPGGPPITAPPSSNLMPILLVGGLGLAALYLLKD